MKTVQELHDERLTRIKKAFNMEKPDRIPIMLQGPGIIKCGNPKAVMADYILRPKEAIDTVAKAYESMPDIDSGGLMNGGDMFREYWMARVKNPGVELGEDAVWQIEEIGAMTAEDYDLIIDKGWAYVKNDILYNRIGYTKEQLAPNMEVMGYSMEVSAKLGLPNTMGGGMANPPYEIISAARSISKFMMDLHRMPDKVIAAFDVVEEEFEESLRQAMKAVPGLTHFHGNSRTATGFISFKQFDKFVWPYFKKLANIIIEEGEGAKCFFHQDACWDDRLEYFLELPRATCIFDPDGMTDMFKLKEVLGDRMCITGDVPAAMLSLGTPDEVHKYCRKLCDEFGPAGGFVMSQGCSLPGNAKPENIRAIVEATVGR